MILIAFAFLFGLIIGSFLNVCIYRWPRDLSILRPSRSFCPNCENTIAWYDNLPVLSWLWLRAKCRNCEAAISYRYPLVEILTALLFALGVGSLGPALVALKFCVFSAMLVVLFFTDLEERILPDEITLLGIVAGIVFAGFVRMPPGLIDLLAPANWTWRTVSLLESATGAVFISAALWGIGELYFRIRRREGLGFGDVKMIGAIGAFLGLQGTLLTLAIGSVLGSICGLIYIKVFQKDAASYELPFGSFLAVAALLVALQMYPLSALFPAVRGML